MNRLKLQLTVYAEQKKKNQIRYTKKKKEKSFKRSTCNRIAP